MQLRRPTIRRLAAAGAAVIGASLCLATPAAAAPPTVPPGTPTATSFAGVPTVGPLFSAGLNNAHGCTASVVASSQKDLLLTAAHCLSGTAAGWLFAPGYDKGRTPFGVWTVTHAYVDRAWITSQDPRDDFAFLQVAHQERDGRSVGVQDVTGGNVLLSKPEPRQRITDVAYNAGIDDQPIRCTIRVYYTAGYPSFNCHGYVGGSSGSPWLTRLPGTHTTFVQGVIGGLHQGGCFEYTSYSSPFGPNVFRLFDRASDHRDPDTVPPAGSDGC